MHAGTLSKAILISFFLYVSNSLSAQENRTQRVCFKFKNYSVEKNKRVQNELKNEKVLFTCIPAGIVIIASQPSKGNSKSAIAQATEKIKRIDSFEIVNDLSIEQAENTCSTYRNGENYK